MENITKSSKYILSCFRCVVKYLIAKDALDKYMYNLYTCGDTGSSLLTLINSPHRLYDLFSNSFLFYHTKDTDKWVELSTEWSMRIKKIIKF